MSKKKPTKRKRGAAAGRSDGLDQQLQDTIRAAAKAVSDAKQAYEKAWRDAFQPLAEEIGYANPKDAAELIMEDVEPEVYDHTAQEWEKHLTVYARRQHLDWKKEELDEELKALEAERSELV